MILAVIGEELGLLGIGVVLFLYGMIAYAGLRAARAATRPVREAGRRRHHVGDPDPGDRELLRRAGRDAADRRAAAVHLLREQQPGRAAGGHGTPDQRRPDGGQARRAPPKLRVVKGTGAKGRAAAKPAARAAGATAEDAPARDEARGPPPRSENLGHMPMIVIAAGGTAGHVVPALAVADELRASGAEVRVRRHARAAPRRSSCRAAGYEISFLSVQRPRPPQPAARRRAPPRRPRRPCRPRARLLQRAGRRRGAGRRRLRRRARSGWPRSRGARRWC